MPDETQEAIDAAIVDAITTPQSSSMGDMSETKRSISDLIKLDERNARKTASRFPFGVARLIPPGH